MTGKLSITALRNLRSTTCIVHLESQASILKRLTIDWAGVDSSETMGISGNVMRGSSAIM